MSAVDFPSHHSAFPAGRLAWTAAFLVLTLGASALHGQQTPFAGAEAVAVMGTATQAMPDGASSPLKPGDRLAAGALVQTGPGSALDVSLGPWAGIVRLAENTAVSLDHVATGASSPDIPVRVRLHLRDGALVGFQNRLTLASKYEIKTATALVAIGAEAFRVDARGRVVVLAGKALVAHVPPGGEPVPHLLKAPPACYFAPQEGVRRAPRALEQEVRAQCKPKLRPR